ncbi:hypothetical protein FACS1894167_08620 [Synergistales bacterium]|nr:hypothetical protein FACS1894167_08620 [Synergistales bacterium]GHV50750.1 hypothetical protein FACS1894216_03480 [Synergistales bacterium]
MKEETYNAKDAQEKAYKLLFGGANPLFLATNGSHGHPNIRAMKPLYMDGVKSIWFATALESSKIIELIKCEKAVIYGYSSKTLAEFRLWGSAVILDDAESRKLVWNDNLKEFFTEGMSDPNMRVLRFDTLSGVYSGKDGKDGTFTL